MTDPSKYDYTMGPGVSREPPVPTEVRIGLSVSDIRRIDLVESTFDIVFFLSFRFIDHRLYFSELDSGCFFYYIARAHPSVEVWWPPIYADKVASAQDVSPEYMAIRSLQVITDKHSEGSETFTGVSAAGFNIRGGRTVAYTLNNDFNPRFFPFDRQLFKIIIATSEPAITVIMIPEVRYGGGPIGISKSFTAASLYCPYNNSLNCTSTIALQKNTASGPKSKLSIYLFLKRNWTGYFFCWIVPLNVNDLPRVQYVTLIETYIFTYCLIIGASCLVFGYVTNVFRDELAYDKIAALGDDVNKSDLQEVSRLLADDATDEHQAAFDTVERMRAVKLDKFCRWAVPLFTAAFNAFCIIWMYIEPYIHPGDIDNVFGQ